jgi:DNA-binding winged helix-turn-helix (wHTH) protein
LNFEAVAPAPGGQTDLVYRFGGFELHAEGSELRHGGALVEADALVLKVLFCLVRSAGQLVTKNQLVEEVWERRAVADNAITVAVARLRKTLNQRRGTPELVTTVYGRGYRFVGEVVIVRAPRPSTTVLSLPSDAALPFVGRDSVLDRLHRALADARAGYGRACLLMGEPGIGKTRAVETFERDVSAPQLRVAWGYCREGGDTPPLAPWIRVLREILGAYSREELESAIGPSANDVYALLGDAAPQPTTSKHAFDVIGPGRHHGFEAIVRALRFAAEQMPRVLVLEDLHRADAGSLELLTYLLDEIGRTRILVLATLRPPLNDPTLQSRLPRVLGHGKCERITVERLRHEDVAKYVSAVLDDPTGALGDAVFTKSEGNPFFMVELTRQMRDLERPDASALTLDHAALELIRQRVARLDAEARGVLSAAAVIGRSFELSLLQVITDRDPAALMASLDDALDAEVVVAAPDSATAFAFGHELLRSVLYDALPAAQRRRWHMRIASALETRANAGETVPASELAYHSYSALPESDLRKTVEFCRAAAGAASVSVYGNPDVVRYLRHALEALALMRDPSPRLRMNLLLWSSVHARGCAHIEYVGILQRALRLAREHNDGAILVQTAYMLNAHPGLEPLPGAHAALQHALTILPADEIESRALGLATMSCVAPDCYSLERSRTLSEQALSLARTSESFVALTAALLCKRYLIGGSEVMDEIDVVHAELAQLAREHPQRLPIVRAELEIHRAIEALQREGSSQLDAALERVYTVCHELRHVELTWHSERWKLLARVNADPSAELLTALDRLHQRAVRYAIIGYGPFRAFDRAVVWTELGQAPAIDDDARQALAVSPFDPPSIWAMKVRAWTAIAEHGADPNARTEARVRLTALSPQEIMALPVDRDFVGTLGHLARAAMTLGAIDHAEVLYRLLSRYPERFAGHVALYCEGSTQQLLGMLALTLGRTAAAMTHLQAAIRRSDGAGYGLRAAEARLQLAACLAAHGGDQQRRRAVSLARQARASAARMGVPKLLAEADRLLEGESRV